MHRKTGSSASTKPVQTISAERNRRWPWTHFCQHPAQHAANPGRDRYGRYVGTCFRADGKDVNRWMVESGYAINRDNPNTGLYAAAQEVARSIGAGMWRGHRRAEPTGAVVEE